MKGEENRLDKLFLNRELTSREKDQRATLISEYLIVRKGIIIATSCRDGILLVGVNPDEEKTIFQVFHRIGLLSIGKIGDIENIHKNALIWAFGTGLQLSKSDIKLQDIAGKIAGKIENNFSYLRSEEGFYRANLIIAELGFKIEEDVICFIDYLGNKSLSKKVPDSDYLLAIHEVPLVDTRDTVIKRLVLDEKGNVQKDEGGNPKIKEELGVKYIFRWPVTEGLSSVIASVTPTREDLLDIKEAALFIGLVARLLNEVGGRLEMAYLDRTMLQKSKAEERRFHHIWKWITNPNPYESLDPWQDWRKFVASVYTKVKKGQLYPKQKFLIEIYEDLEKKGFDKKNELQKMKKEELVKLIVHLLGNKSQGNQQKSKK